MLRTGAVKDKSAGAPFKMDLDFVSIEKLSGRDDGGGVEADWFSAQTVDKDLQGGGWGWEMVG